MTYRALLIALVAVLPVSVGALNAGCGSEITVDLRGNTTDGGGGGYVFIDGGTGGDKPDSAWPDSALPDYVDPGCDNTPPPLQQFDCDPYNQNNGDCALGEGCYIFVDYPSEPCGQEIYGAYCSLQGTGQQGDGCGGGIDCAGGFVCVITGSGTQCVQLCNLSGNDGCPSGLVCEPIDVAGFGGCL